MPDAAPTAPITPNPDPQPQTPPPTPPAQPPAAPAQPTDVASLPDWAQKIIREARDEAAGYRTKANETATAHQASLDAIAKALGLKQDDDPAAVAKVTAEERDAARQEAKEIRVENAVLKAARKHDADPEALTDSRSFMSKLAALDPNAADFTQQLDAVIKAAVDANPLLRLTAPAPRSGGPVGGGAPPPGQLSRDDLKSMRPEDITKAKAEGRLNAILGIQ